MKFGHLTDFLFKNHAKDGTGTLILYTFCFF